MSSNSLVTILIKAPNQLVEDQSIECERHWTVRRLKQHLANVYPCRPHPDGQKLIYSGQLLSDELVLSDVLRSYDGMENNTIHLVCSIKYPQPISRHAAEPARNPRLLQLSQENATPRTVRDGLRQRTPVMPAASAQDVPTSQVNPNPQNIIQQNLLLHQAYLNYVAQVRQLYMMTSRGGTAENINFNPNMYNTTQPDNNIVEQDYLNDRNQEEAVEEVNRDENRANRDWLEWFYIISRIIILFTVVYFYSSPERLIMVIAMAFILLNIDVLRWRRAQNPIETIPGDNNTESVRPPRNPVQQNNWIYIVWTFMKTFLLSLVPENGEL